MASEIKVAGKNLMLETLRTSGTHLALYTDLAGTTEVTGGSPAYARKTVSWGAVSGGILSNSTQVVFDVPAGTVVRAIGICSAITGGTQYVIDEPSVIETWAGQGTATIGIGQYTVTLT